MSRYCSDGFVGREHEFLDQAVRDISLAANDALHAPGFVEFNDRFRKIEINRAALVAPAIEQQRQLLHPAEFIHQRSVALAHFRIAFEHLVDVGVGHAFRGADHAGCEIGADHFPGRVHFHDRAHHQAVNFRIQRADSVRKFLRQHRHRAVREIDGSAAQARFAIERRIALDVVRDVRDVHLQLEMSIRQRADQNRVVEIARGFAVNRHDRQVAEIAAPAQIRFGHLLLRGARLREHFGSRR